MIFFKYFGYVWLLIFALPLFLLGAYTLLGLFISFESIQYFMRPSFINVMLHSITLSALVALLSLFLGLGVGLGFYTLKTKLFKLLYILLLMISFVLQPIILLSTFQGIDLFLHRDAFLQSLCIFVMHLTPLSGLAFIYIFSTLNSLSLQSALAIAPLKYSIQYIIFPQLKPYIGSVFMLLFILVFIDQAVPSILGYRTYTEDLLAQMTLMENMKHIALAALPSYFLVGILILLWSRVKKHLHLQTYIATITNTKLQFPWYWLGASMLLFGVLYLVWIIISLSMETFTIAYDSYLEENLDVIGTSIGFSFSTALVTLGIALMMQHILEKYASRFLQYLLY